MISKVSSSVDTMSLFYNSEQIKILNGTYCTGHENIEIESVHEQC